MAAIIVDEIVEHMLFCNTEEKWKTTVSNPKLYHNFSVWTDVYSVLNDQIISRISFACVEWKCCIVMRVPREVSLRRSLLLTRKQ
uniref:Uncharacterized protein n=1 Tax=Anopheles quadriannulatus TaxID=34691 RepID=A0A182XTH9_ANOQN